MNGPGGAQVQLSFRGSSPEAFDELLVCTGRTPNVEGLGLEAAGVELTKEGRVAINDSLHTPPPNIYAVGDVSCRLSLSLSLSLSLCVCVYDPTGTFPILIC